MLRIRAGAAHGFQGCLAARAAPLSSRHFLPLGYAFHFATAQRSDFIERHEAGRAPDFSLGSESRFVPGGIFKLVWERRGEHVTMSVDGQPSQHRVELLPMRGAGLNRIGFRGLEDAQRLLELRVYRLTLPEKANPVIAGDALLEAGQPREAIAQYMTIASDFRGRSVAALAMTKAFIAAAEEQPHEASPELARIQDEIRTRVLREHPGYEHRAQIAEADALMHWAWKDFAGASAAAAAALAQNPASQIVPAMLERSGWRLSATEQAEAMRLLRQTRNVRALRLDGLGLASLEGLRGLPLERLRCRDNALTSLEPLRGMPLTWLDFTGNKVADLAPLRGLPLAGLLAEGNPLASLAPLAGMPLQTLRLTAPDGTNARALRKLPLRELHGRAFSQEALDAVRGLPLERLHLDGGKFTSLEPLRGMNFHTLWCNAAPLATLEPLRGAHIKHLTISWTHRLESLDPLRGMTLSTLACEGNKITSLEPLRGMPLEELACSLNPLTSLDPFIEDPPPAKFEFNCETLPEHELERAIAAWSRDPQLAPPVARARKLVALRRNDPALLRALARQENGRRYLLIPRHLGWEDAMKFCAAMGGHLATASSAEEWQILTELQRKAGTRYAWLGGEAARDGWRWITGEPWKNLRAIDPAGPSAPRALVANNTERGAAAHPREWQHPFIVEWE